MLLHFRHSQSSVIYLRIPLNLAAIHSSFIHSRAVFKLAWFFLRVRPIAIDLYCNFIKSVVVARSSRLDFLESEFMHSPLLDL